MNWQARLLRRLGVPLPPMPERRVLNLERLLAGAEHPPDVRICRVCGGRAVAFVTAPLAEQGTYCARCVPTGPLTPAPVIPS